MYRNRMEMFGGFTSERDVVKRALHNCLRDCTSRLKEKGGVEDVITGKRYIPEVGPGYCTLTVVNDERNLKEEIYCGRNLRFFSYKVWTMDFSMQPMEFNFNNHRDIVTDNVDRILVDVENILSAEESSSS